MRGGFSDTLTTEKHRRQGTPLLRARVTLAATLAEVPVEFHSWLEVRQGGGWQPFGLQSRAPIEIGEVLMPVPKRDELADMLARYGDSKERALGHRSRPDKRQPCCFRSRLLPWRSAPIRRACAEWVCRRYAQDDPSEPSEPDAEIRHRSRGHRPAGCRLLRADPRAPDMLGPVFAPRDRARSGPEWRAHEAKIAAFWRNAIGIDRSYDGNPMQVHVANPRGACRGCSRPGSSLFRRDRARGAHAAAGRQHHRRSPTGSARAALCRHPARAGRAARRRCCADVARGLCTRGAADWAEAHRDAMPPCFRCVAAQNGAMTEPEPSNGFISPAPPVPG